MSALYSLRTTSKGFIVTKFDDDFNVESYYEMTQSDGELHCGCPAGARPTCRHRQMFPQLVDRPDSGWFLDFDTRAWVDPTGEAAGLDDSELVANEMRDGLEKDELVQPKPEPTKDPFEHILGKDPTRKYIGSYQNVPICESSTELEKPVSLPDSHPFRRRM